MNEKYRAHFAEPGPGSESVMFGISVATKIYNGRKFKSIANLINSTTHPNSNRKNIILTGEGILRFNLAMKNNLSPEEFKDASKLLGDSWENNNEENFDKNNSMILRYFDALKTKTCIELHERILNAAETDESFKFAVEKSASEYLRRYKKSLVKEGYDISKFNEERALAYSKQAIKEELAVIFATAKDHKITEFAYPHIKLEAFQACQNLFEDDIPLNWHRIKTQKIKSQKVADQSLALTSSTSTSSTSSYALTPTGLRTSGSSSDSSSTDSDSDEISGSPPDSASPFPTSIKPAFDLESMAQKVMQETVKDLLAEKNTTLEDCERYGQKYGAFFRGLASTDAAPGLHHGSRGHSKLMTAKNNNAQQALLPPSSSTTHYPPPLISLNGAPATSFPTVVQRQAPPNGKTRHSSNSAPPSSSKYSIVSSSSYIPRSTSDSKLLINNKAIQPAPLQLQPQPTTGFNDGQQTSTSTLQSPTMY